MNTFAEAKLKIEFELNRLKSINWFVNVGNFNCSDKSVRSVESWKDALKLTDDPVSKWCSVEAKKCLLLAISESFPERKSDWIPLSQDTLPKTQYLLDEIVFPSMKSNTLNDRAKLWIQSQITGHLISVGYEDCIKLNLYDSIIFWFSKGFFPCGWYVEKPENFPAKSIVFVY